ncbi:hypothetical protein AMK09_14280 [Streptomyces sp. CB02488]|nr:hypothetical protein AMK09_14280 [Streptomyces sp. CB02488]
MRTTNGLRGIRQRGADFFSGSPLLPRQGLDGRSEQGGDAFGGRVPQRGQFEELVADGDSEQGGDDQRGAQPGIRCVGVSDEFGQWIESALV